MKVLDLQCAHGHVFEGWFASEDDFLAQCEKSLVQCPVCGDPSVAKKLSAPRLNLAGGRSTEDQQQLSMAPARADQALTAAWLAVARQIVANTADVGDRFAEEARKMHYREAEERSIRGTTTVEEARALLDEGIEILPLVLPTALKEPLQ
ncbi:MAG: DUF1178 family protein [Rhodoferax sp.]